MSSRAAVSASEFKKTILGYYETYGRSFPWRETRNPYHIFISEIMLQQTQTDRVVPKYENWLESFPDVASLAAAPFSSVLSSWVGLGYNRRAKNLHEACRILHTDYAGLFPADPELLQKLPGVGPYTANAVSTFAFNRPNVFIETNIRSVYMFFFFPEQVRVSDKDILPIIDQTLDHENPREWYYALMDYGADLKKRIPNPNRNCINYTKQTRFEGSPRQARGCVLRYLAREKKATVPAIAEAEGIDEKRIHAVLPALVKEGMVHESEGIYFVGC